MMKRLLILIFVLLAVFTFLLFKSKALLIYRVTEIRKGYRHTSRKVAFEWEVFLDYLKDIPDRATGRVFSRGIKAPQGIRLTDKEQGSIKNLIKDSGLLSRETKTEYMDISQELKDLLGDRNKLLEGLELEE